MRPGSIIRLTLLLAGLHLILALGSFWIGFSSGMERFDAGTPIEASPFEATASVISKVLLQPMLGIWNLIFVGRSSPAFLQWLAILLNSLLWGIVVAVVAFSARAHLRPR